MIDSSPDPTEGLAVGIPGSTLRLDLPAAWGIREADERTISLIGHSGRGGPVAPLVSVRFLTSAEAPSMPMAATGIVISLGTALNDLQIVEGAEALLGAGPAHRIVATCRQGIFAMATDHILVERSNGILWMGLTCLTDDYAAASEDLDAMVSSVREATDS